MKHAQRTEKYIRLIFNSYISDGDFFRSPCALWTRTSFFLEIFKAKRGCALYNPKYGMLKNIYVITFLALIRYYVIKFVSDLWLVGGFLLILWFPPQIKLTPAI